ncbi:MAG: helix-turn-helix domain-containing protein [bacterium]|nr:helix-turn-helix domain-containing protein [bacterium]
MEVSPWHFQRYFKSLIGDSLGSYIWGRRLSRAASLLLETDWGILKIGVEVGFGSHEAFTRAFKVRFGLTPKEFRRRRPSVVLQEKPRLEPELLLHLTQGMQKAPTVIYEPAFELVGFSRPVPSPFYGGQSYCQLLHEPWTDLLNRQGEVKQRWPGCYAGLLLSPSGDFTEETIEYLAAVPRKDEDSLPQGMRGIRFEAQWVARFDVFAGVEDHLAKTVDYIYGYWLPRSGYQRGPGSDYEWFEGVSDFTAPGLKSQYVVPLLPKD